MRTWSVQHFKVCVREYGNLHGVQKLLEELVVIWLPVKILKFNKIRSIMVYLLISSLI
jgi:hypothetical protein